MRGLFSTTSDGKHICPNCKEPYEPDADSFEEAKPNTIYREQYMTGICSQECWEDYLGPNPSES